LFRTKPKTNKKTRKKIVYASSGKKSSLILTSFEEDMELECDS